MIVEVEGPDAEDQYLGFQPREDHVQRPRDSEAGHTGGQPGIVRGHPQAVLDDGRVEAGGHERGANEDDVRVTGFLHSSDADERLLVVPDERHGQPVVEGSCPQLGHGHECDRHQHDEPPCTHSPPKGRDDRRKVVASLP